MYYLRDPYPAGPIPHSRGRLPVMRSGAEEVISENGAAFVVENYLDLLNPAVVFCESLTGLALRYPRFFRPLSAMQIRKDAPMRIFFSNTITLVDFQAGSHSANTISPGAKCQLDCRLMPGQDIEGFIESIKNKINNPDIEFTVSSSFPGTGVSSSDEGYYSIFEKTIKKNYPSAAVVPVILPGYTDCIHFRNKGIPSYGSNPMLMSEEILSTIHNYNERLPIDALYTGIRVYYDFLAGMLENKPGY